jgi:hypothetical protein
MRGAPIDGQARGTEYEEKNARPKQHERCLPRRIGAVKPA